MIAINRVFTTWYRPILVAAGVIAFLRGVIGLYKPDYWSPTTMLDYAAVVFTSLTFVSLALGLGGFFLHQLQFLSQGSTVWRVSMVLASLSAGTIGLSNLLEDGLQVRWLGWVWVVGILLLTVSLFVAGISAFWVKALPRFIGGLLLISSAGVLWMTSFGLFLLGLALFTLGLLESKVTRADRAVA